MTCCRRVLLTIMPGLLIGLAVEFATREGGEIGHFRRVRTEGNVEGDPTWCRIASDGTYHWWDGGNWVPMYAPQPVRVVLDGKLVSVDTIPESCRPIKCNEVSVEWLARRRVVRWARMPDGHVAVQVRLADHRDRHWEVWTELLFVEYQRRHR